MVDSSNQIPRIYLDQNALSEVAKGNLPGLLNVICSGKAQLLYSRVNIEEIARCRNREFQSSAVQAIAAMNGVYIQEIENNPSAGMTPQQRLEAYHANPEVYNQVVESMHQFAHKFFGGQQGIGFQPLIEGQRDALADVLRHMNESIEALSVSEKGEIRKIFPFPEMLPELIGQHFEEQTSNLLSSMETSIPSPETFDGPQELRACLGLGPKQLNNIRPPNVVQKLWDKIKSSGKLPEQIQSLDGYLTNGVWASMNSGNPTWIDKINSLYNLLNFIGYWPDENLRSNKGFRRAMGDQTHAGFAACAQALISGDERLVKKTLAVYEHFGVRTLVYWMKKQDGGFVLLEGAGAFNTGEGQNSSDTTRD